MGFFKRMIDYLTLGSDRPLRRLVAYYTVLAVVVVVVFHFFPVIGRLFSGEGIDQVSGGPQVLRDGLAQGQAAAAETLPRFQLAFTTFFVFVASLALMLPVTWVYMSARREPGHNQSIVQALIVLPIVVAGIVLIVSNSLARAFSLAGIVAAVRFKTNLGDARDVVFIMLAIAVGFASGVQVMTVSVVLSVVFNFVILFTWRYDFGRNVLEPTAASHWAQPLNEMAQIGGNGKVPDRDLALALTPKKVQILSDRFDRIHGILGSKGKKARFNSIVTVRTNVLSEAQERVEKVLEEVTKRWKLDEVVNNQGKPSELFYLAKLRKATTEDALLTAIRANAGDKIDSVDLEMGVALDKEQGEERAARKEREKQ